MSTEVAIKVFEYAKKEEGVVYRTFKIPEGVEVEVIGSRVRVTGPLGTLEKDFGHAKVDIRVEDGRVVVSRRYRRKFDRAIVGTITSKIKNMVIGVLRGYVYELRIVWTHFPMDVKVDKERGVVYIEKFIGETVPRVAKIIGNVEIEVDKNEGRILVKGIDLDEVSQTAANIQLATKIKDRDPRKFLDGIYISVRGAPMR